MQQEKTGLEGLKQRLKKTKPTIKKMESIYLTYHDLTLEVCGFFEPGEQGDYETPGCPPEFKSQFIYLNGDSFQDIHGILSSSTITDIEQICVNEILDN